jgi:hypothetical protein
MLKIAKNSHWLQTLIVRFIASTHPVIGHNVEKIGALKKAFYLANLEGIAGDYVEFGMFEGTSFIGALECHNRTRLADSPSRAFWGYDSFGGFKYSSPSDAHPFFREGEFRSSYEKTRARIARHFRHRAAWTITPGLLENTIKGRTAPEMGINQVAVAFIDVDLGEPARIALNFLRPALRPGCIVILDDYFAYKGSVELGVAGAFAAFCREHPELSFRRLFDYGYGGQGFILAADVQDAILPIK